MTTQRPIAEPNVPGLALACVWTVELLRLSRKVAFHGQDTADTRGPYRAE